MNKFFQSFKGVIRINKKMMENCPFSLDLSMFSDADIQAMLDLAEFELEKYGITSTSKSLEYAIMCKLLAEQYNVQLNALAFETGNQSQIA